MIIIINYDYSITLLLLASAVCPSALHYESPVTRRPGFRTMDTLFTIDPTVLASRPPFLPQSHRPIANLMLFLFWSPSLLFFYYLPVTSSSTWWLMLSASLLLTDVSPFSFISSLPHPLFSLPFLLFISLSLPLSQFPLRAFLLSLSYGPLAPLKDPGAGSTLTCAGP